MEGGWGGRRKEYEGDLGDGGVGGGGGGVGVGGGGGGGGEEKNMKETWGMLGDMHSLNTENCLAACKERLTSKLLSC